MCKKLFVSFALSYNRTLHFNYVKKISPPPKHNFLESISPPFTEMNFRVQKYTYWCMNFNFLSPEPFCHIEKTQN